MVPPTTRPTVGVLALLLLTAGCLTGAPADPGAAPTQTPTPTPTDTPPAATPTPGETGTPPASPDGNGTPPPTDWHQQAMNEPDPDHPVTVENDWNQSVTAHVRVIRNATGETVHDANHTVPAGTDRTVYNTAEADPEGVETFTVVVTARNTTEHLEIETSKCYGTVLAVVSDDGEFYLTYAIC